LKTRLKLAENCYRHSRNDKNSLREGFAIREINKTVCERVSPFAKWQNMPARRFRRSRNQ